MHSEASATAAISRTERMFTSLSANLRSLGLPVFIHPLVLHKNCLTLPRHFSERKAHRENPAVVVLVELRHGNLHTRADGEAKSLRDWKTAEDNPRCQEDLFLSVQDAARPKLGVLLDHRPDPPFYFAVDSRIENDGPAEDVRAGGGKVCANRGLNIELPDTLGGCESWRKNCVTDAVWWKSGRQRTAKKESYEIVTVALGCGKRPILHLERQIAKPICHRGPVCQIVGRRNADLQPGCGNDFKA